MTKNVLGGYSIRHGLLLLMVFFAGVLPACSPEQVHSESSSSATQKYEDTYIKTVIEYVTRTKEWEFSKVSVKFIGRDGKYLVFEVQNTQKPFFRPAGNTDDSFTVSVNPETNKVEKEMHYE